MDTQAAETAFWNLVAAARAEQGISADEQRVLNAHVLKLGLDPESARRIQKEAEAEQPPRIRIPTDGPGRLATLRAVLEVVAADGGIAPKELAIVRALADRLALDEATLDRLVRAALLRSKQKLDAVFAGIAISSGEPGIEIVERPSPRTDPVRRLEALRGVPFAARWAPRFRSCRNCKLSFTSEDAYASYCRDCRISGTISELSGGRIETLAGALFLLLCVPTGFLVEHFTGLWSWGWTYMWTPRRYGSYRRGRSDWVAIVPAVALTAAIAWILAWALSALVSWTVRRPRRDAP